MRGLTLYFTTTDNMDKKQRIRKRASSAAPNHTPSHASLNLFNPSSSQDEHSGAGYRHSPGPSPTPTPKHFIAVKNNHSNNNSVSLHNSSATARDKENSSSFSFGGPHHAESVATLSSSNTLTRPLQEEGAEFAQQSASLDVESVRSQ